MPVELIPCGDYANESERRAAERLRDALDRHAGGGDRWVILTNVAHAASPRAGISEIDQVVIGPTGLFVVEVKHWGSEFLRERAPVVEREAAKLNEKVKKVKGGLPRDLAEALGFLAGSFLLTDVEGSLGGGGRRDRPNQNGCAFYSLEDWRELLEFGGIARLRDGDVARVVGAISPRAKASVDGSLRQVDGFRDLTLLTPPDERFHRVFRGRDPRRDPVVLHLYDLSAHRGGNAERVARRASEAIQALQASPHVPRVVETFREVSGYPGELYLFATRNPAAPPVAERRGDEAWPPAQRLRFAARAFEALAGLQRIAAEAKGPVAHRNITPDTLLIAAGDEPVFTGFDLAKFPGSVTVAPGDGMPGSVYLPPELTAGSAADADFRSDVYSLARTLRTLFEDGPPLPLDADEAMFEAESEDPDERPTAVDLARRLKVAAGDAEPVTPPARFWAEGQVVRFGRHRYRLESRLGSGSFGTTYKVVELDAAGEDVGTFVAKVVPDREAGERALRAAQRVKQQSDHPNLALVHQQAGEWRDNEFIALMRHVAGDPLGDWAGTVALYAEEHGLAEEEALLGWARQLCSGLARLHAAGLVHGDVSPNNVLIAGPTATLTDFDTVLRAGESRELVGTRGYQPPEAAAGAPADPSHDVYALAAVLFEAAHGRRPFEHGGESRPEAGCCWGEDASERWNAFRPFVDRATAAAPEARFRDAAEALAFLSKPIGKVSDAATPEERDPVELAPHPTGPEETPDHRGTDLTSQLESAAQSMLAPAETLEAVPVPTERNEVPWLKELLQAYPGGRHGNAETRGLDSDFALATYIDTPLDRELLEAVRDRRARLVVLCGNAGDGKTALLQRLFEQLGLPRQDSSNRVRDESLNDGLRVRANLDGSAAYDGRSADELMDELLLPFLDGLPDEDACHLLAVNDGRLLEWVEGCEEEHGERWLTRTLEDLLAGNATATEGVRFVNLNARSLVGEAGDGTDDGGSEGDFLGSLIDRMVRGPLDVATTWQPCGTCLARDRCRVRRTVDELRSPIGDLIRRRLRRSLQAVHQRGEVHITARELRGVVSYVLFGTSYCTEIHNAGDLPRYPRLTFDAGSDLRQGELLAELARLDPALDAQPRLDRHLRASLLTADASGARQDPERLATELADARRTAYFVWSRTDQQAAGGRVRLHGGEHLSLFRKVATMDEAGRREVCRRLCAGISRLEDLPANVLGREGRTIIKVTPRTPIEGAFWAEKPADRFELEPELPAVSPGVITLHRHLTLRYHYQDGSGRIEELRLNSELFGLLLELERGYQISDVASDATFAHLSIFTQRLAQEEERALFAWTPADEGSIYEIRPEMVNEVQRLALYPVGAEVGEEAEHAKP